MKLVHKKYLFSIWFPLDLDSASLGSKKFLFCPCVNISLVGALFITLHTQTIPGLLPQKIVIE